MRQVYLTTEDNPFSPHDQFEEWYQLDQALGHYSSELLARVAVVSDDLPDKFYFSEIEKAIDEIIEWDFVHGFKKLVVDESES